MSQKTVCDSSIIFLAEELLYLYIVGCHTYNNILNERNYIIKLYHVVTDILLL